MKAEGMVEDWRQQRESLLQALRSNPRGLSWCYEFTTLVDRIIEQVARAVPGLLPNVAIVGVGGYGRRELSPASDIDLTLIPVDESSAETDRAIRHFFRDLHTIFRSELKIEIAYAYRLISDAPGLDAKTRTGLVDARLVVGSNQHYLQLLDALEDSFPAGEFILAKIDERTEQLAKFNDTPLSVEPHLKEGAGGIRSFNCANWIRSAINEREKRPTKDYDSVVRMRNLLHLVCGKQNDHLTRSRQNEIADLLGVDALQMMSAHAKHATAVHAEYLSSIEKLQESRFNLSRSGFAMRGETWLSPEADAGDAAVAVSVATRLGLRTPEFSSSRFSAVTGPAAAYALNQGEASIRNIERSGLLAFLIPELEACRYLIPNDAIHAFTVFEHSLRVVRHLETLPDTHWLSSISGDIRDREYLVMAALLHDIGKQKDEASHEAIGAQMATEILERWRVSDQMVREVSWLVRHHLAVSHVLRFRDLADPGTIEEFLELVKSKDRLAMLCLLAYADVNAVAPDLWTPAMDAALEELFLRCSQALDLQGSPSQPPERKRLVRELQKENVSDEAVEDFVAGLPIHYLNSTPMDKVREHVRLVERARNGGNIIEAQKRQDLGATEYTICCKDSAGLLSKLLGCFYALDLRVQQFRVSTTEGEPVALDTFLVNFGGKPLPRATVEETTEKLSQLLSGELKLDDLLLQKGKDPAREQRVLSHRYIPGHPGILEIRAPRGRGLPYRISRWITRQGWNITSARLGQWAENASAALYLTDGSGGELSAEAVGQAFALRD